MKNLGPELIGWLDMYRVERHTWFYGVESLGTEETEAEDAIDRSNRFIDAVCKILKK